MRKPKKDTLRVATMKRICQDLGYKYHSGRMYRQQEGKIRQVPDREVTILLESYGVK